MKGQRQQGRFRYPRDAYNQNRSDAEAHEKIHLHLIMVHLHLTNNDH